MIDDHERLKIFGCAWADLTSDWYSVPRTDETEGKPIVMSKNPGVTPLLFYTHEEYSALPLQKRS